MFRNGLNVSEDHDPGQNVPDLLKQICLAFLVLVPSLYLSWHGYNRLPNSAISPLDEFQWHCHAEDKMSFVVA